MSTPQDNENIDENPIELDHQSSLGSASPRLETLEFTPMSPYYAKINAFSAFIGWAIILVILFTVNLLVDKIDLHFIVLPIIGAVSIVSAIFGYFSAKACGYFRGEFDLLYKEGLWWRKQTALSFSRIQHIDISHGPLERKYGLATIKFFTAGGVASDLKIPGITNQIAEQLRSQILQYSKTEYDDRQSESEDHDANNTTKMGSAIIDISEYTSTTDENIENGEEVVSTTKSMEEKKSKPGSSDE